MLIPHIKSATNEKGCFRKRIFLKKISAKNDLKIKNRKNTLKINL